MSVIHFYWEFAWGWPETFSAISHQLLVSISANLVPREKPWERGWISAYLSSIRSAFDFADGNFTYVPFLSWQSTFSSAISETELKDL